MRRSFNQWFRILALCLTPALYIRSGQSAPERPWTNGHSAHIVDLLRIVLNYDLFRRPVTIRALDVAGADELLSIAPSTLTTHSEGLSDRSQHARNWMIKVRFSKGHVRPKIAATNVRRRRRMPILSRAVYRAAKYLAGPNHNLDVPVEVTAMKIRNQYLVGFASVPATPGAFTIVVLSRNLKLYRILPGA